MYKIDSHQHFWRYDPIEYGWIDEPKAAIRRDFLPSDLKVEIASAGVSGVVSVQARQTLAETNWLLELAHENEFIKGVVGWAPLIAPDIADTLGALAENSALRGVRHVLQDEPDPDYMLRADFHRGIDAVTAAGLLYDILVFERQLPHAIRMVDRHPHQVFVLDHIAKPRIADGETSPWRENIAQLAYRPNVFCKLSGLVTEASYTNWTEQRIRPYIDVVLNAFGPRRIMFGSDWPVCLAATSYRDWVRIVGNIVGELSADEQDRIWRGAAMQAYRLIA